MRHPLDCRPPFSPEIVLCFLCFVVYYCRNLSFSGVFDAKSIYVCVHIHLVRTYCPVYGKSLRQPIAPCRAAGYQPVPCSGYRSPEEQEKIFDDKLREYRYLGYSEEDAEKETEKWIQLPGTSEHHTGLAMDIIDLDYQILDEAQNKTATQQWLMKHCYEYGFIVRYPDDKKDITHIQFESWHYRYVGKENAKKIHDSGLCLEEYLTDMPA